MRDGREKWQKKKKLRDLNISKRKRLKWSLLERRLLKLKKEKKKRTNY